MSFEEAFQAARGFHTRGELDKAIDSYARALEHAPANAKAWYFKAVAEQQSGNVDSALDSARRGIAAGGDLPAFLLFERNLLHDRGDLAAAEERFARAAAARPRWLPALMALGRARLDRARFDAAREAFAAAVEADPGHARAWNNLGVALERLACFDEAAEAFAKSVTLDPGYALANLNLARALDGRDSAAAIRHAEAAVRADPRLAEAWLLLSDIHRRHFSLEHALSAAESGLRLSPGHARLAAARAEILSHMGRTDESAAAYRELAARLPDSFRAALGANLLLPRIYESVDHLEEARHGYEAGLARLRDGRYRFSAPEVALAEARWTNFYLPYHGRDDRALQETYGDVLRGVLASELPELFERRSRRPRGRLRVGFLSNYFFNCVAGRYFASWVTDLDRRRFEVFVYHMNETMAEDTKAIAATAQVFRPLAGRALHDVARQVIADQLDVLVYPELGMHPETFALAALRLAPVQCAAWGHPTTTGLPEIDWFISPGEMEPADAQSLYRERLALLPGLGTRYALPAPEAQGTRADFGIPEGRTAYLVSQSLFKIHPDNDAVIAEVLARDRRAVAVMFRSSREELNRAFTSRFGRVLERRGMAIGERVVFLPFVPHAAYLRINRLCDVMLDTLHWSGGNTTLDAIASALPVVTLPGALMRGRQSLGMLRIVGVPELAAGSVDEYVEFALRLGGSAEERDAFSRRIEAGRAALFGRAEPIRALEDLLERVAGEDR